MFGKKKYNKLVRDNVPDIIGKDDKASYSLRIADDRDYVIKGAAKVVEEAEEVQEAAVNLLWIVDDPYCADDVYLDYKAKLVEEMADLKEALAILQKYFNIPSSDIKVFRKKKAEEKGIFDKRYILEWVKRGKKK